ncbi:MAG: DUF4159 domain-containing protein, partial [Flavobacteriaceae bacterium]|nr:DUF4159 domain-containing protein [Flavobacteriaceae bacterium]
MRWFYSFFLFFVFGSFHAQELAILKYNGGGDWYGNPTSLPNLIKFCNQQIHTALNEKPQTVSPLETELYNYPFIHMTGH